MNKNLNHLSDFGALGGVQSYLLGLKSHSSHNIKLYTTRKPIDIYSESLKSKNLKFLKFINFSLIDRREIFIFHNFILAKIWPFLEKSQLIFNKPLIYHEHGTAWHNPDKNFNKYQKRISKVDCIIVNSSATSKLLKELYGIKKEINILRSPIFIYEKTEQNNLGKHDEHYQSINKKNKITLGYIGRLEKHKNPVFLLKLVKRLKILYNLNVCAELIGSGKEIEFLQNYANEFNLNVKFHGLVKDRTKLIEKWDFVIFPSIREPLGLIQGEMPLLNKLCLSSNIDGIPELYPPYTNELLINMKKIKNKAKTHKKNQSYQLINQINKFDFDYFPDIEDCSNKLIQLINNPKLCKSLLKKHQSYIKSNFSIEKHLLNLNNIMDNYFIN